MLKFLWENVHIHNGEIQKYKKSYIENVDNIWVVATLKDWREVCHNLKLNEDGIFFERIGQ